MDFCDNYRQRLCWFVRFMCSSTTATMFYWLERTANEEQEQEEKKCVTFLFCQWMNAVYFGIFVCLFGFYFSLACCFLILRFCALEFPTHARLFCVCFTMHCRTYAFFEILSNYTKTASHKHSKLRFSYELQICALVIFKSI